MLLYLEVRTPSINDIYVLNYWEANKKGWLFVEQP